MSVDGALHAELKELRSELPLRPQIQHLTDEVIKLGIKALRDLYIPPTQAPPGQAEPVANASLPPAAGSLLEEQP